MEAIGSHMDGIDHTRRKQTERWWHPQRPVDADGLVLHHFGIDERMPPSVITHGGRGCPWLLIQFHSPAQAILPGGEARDMEGQALLWPPGATHRYGHPARGWRHSWINFDGPVAERILRAHRVPIGEPIAAAHHDLLRRWLLLMADELQQWERPDPGVLHRLFDLLAYELGRRAPQQRNRVPPAVQAARAQIESRLGEPLHLDQLARLAAVDPAYLCRIFKAWIGLPPLAYQRRLRLQRAAQLLLDQGTSVGDAAAAVGFADPLHFSRLFRRWAGLAPQAWRQREWRRPMRGGPIRPDAPPKRRRSVKPRPA
jgi:AraC-like DNA-binding protein